jgi:putative ABC transport system ATP-binding protein
VLARRPGHGAATQHMHMHMPHRLAGIGIAVHDCAVTTFGNTLIGSNLFCRQVHPPNKLGILLFEVVQGGDVLFWNDQKMHGRLRINVSESQHLIIFIQYVRLDLALRHFAKQAFVSHYGLPDLRFNIQAKYITGQAPATRVTSNNMKGLTIRALKANGIGPLDLEIAPGECVCLSGISGSGKSLTLRAIADLDPSEGELYLNDRRSVDMSGPEWRRNVGLLPAESQWWANTVGEHFADGKEYIEKVGFDRSVRDWQVARLSTGEKQRLALARLLANSPKVLLLDEPTASLDRDNIVRVEALIEAYQQQHQCAVLWVSHDPEQIDRVSGRHLKINRGQFEEA